MPKPAPLWKRLAPKITITDECWNWDGALVGGYGHILEKARGGKVVKAHRMVWELLVGPIPNDMTLDHLCYNRACVNPGHLEVVTRAENASRAQQRKKGFPVCPTCHGTGRLNGGQDAQQ